MSTIPALADEEKVKIRHHLGYINVGQGSTFFLGSPATVEINFAIENAMTKLLPQAYPLVREMLARCDATEQQLFDNQENLAVTKVCDIELRSDEMKELDKRYDRWRGALANALGVYFNPWDKRDVGGASGVNVPVVG